jgi:6-phosphogluconolactonase
MEKQFENRVEASRAAAEHIAERLMRRLAAQGKASLVVSGGTTPVDCFAALAGMPLDWANVHIVPSDERWVPPDHVDSNEKLVRDTLMTGEASAASLLPLYSASTDISEHCARLNEDLLQIPFPFAVSLLGMGEDGHFASLFPDAENLDEGLEVDSRTLCLPIQTTGSEHWRVSLTLAALSRSDEIILLIFGDAKLAVLEEARRQENGLPVSRLLRQKRAPVRVFWAP